MFVLKCWTISASAMLGGVYGLVATLRFHAGAFTYADVAVPVVAGAALAAIVASALCRMIQMWQLMRSARNQPMNDVLCYRGVQCLPPVPRLMPDCESPNAPVNGELCYRGTPVSPSISNSEWEIHHSPVDVTLCYRGIHYWQKQTVVEQSTVPCQVAGTVRPARLVASAS